MKIREDIIDLPIKYKKTSTFILAGLYASYVFFDDIKPLYDIATELDINNKILYKKLATETLKTLGVGFCTNLSLQSLGFMQKPRLKNLLSTLTMGLPLTIRYIFNPSPKSLESLIEFSEDTLNPPNPNAIQEDRAKLHLMRGELGHGILQYSKYLETQRDKISDKSFFVKLLTLPLKKLYQVRALLDKRISTQFDYIFSCLENGDESTAYEKVWPRILNQNSSLEIKLAHALSLSKSSRTEEAKNLWHEIIENQKDKLQIIGESRNEVLEITCSEELKGTIIIKIGEKKRKDNFTREAYVLSEAYKSTSISNLFTPALVIHYSDDNEVLITFRRNAKNLDKTINEKSSEASMLSLARLHSLKLKLPEYDLLIELNRRLVEKRLGNPADAYPLFHEIKKLLEKQEGKKITSHCDFFPTNVLDDGTIIDLETAALHYPAFDIENFRSHPNTPRSETAVKKYLELRSEIEAREIKLYNRHLYRVLCPTFQIGSFFAKGDDTSSIKFLETTLEGIKETGLTQLKDPLMFYLNSTPLKALL